MRQTERKEQSFLNISERYWLGAIGILLFLVLWQIGASIYSPIILPSPWLTLKTLSLVFLNGTALEAAIITTIHTFSGFFIALLVGGFLGAVAGLNITIRHMVWPVVSILQGTPPVAWLVLALLWFGSGGAASVLTVTLAILPLFFVAVLEGVRTADKSLLEMAKTFQTPAILVWWDVYLPHLLSFTFPALVTGLGIAWKVAVMGELMGSERGIGAELFRSRTSLDTAEALAWIVLVVVLMFSFEYLILHPLKNRLEPWRHST